MCRLFVQHASPDHDLRAPLCTAHNALRVQSHRHPHGWGIGWYDAAGVQVRRGVMPAHADAEFLAAAREARSEIVLAHVRDASIGAVAAENTHPFVHGRWLFAHNGTVARYQRVRWIATAIEAEIDPRFRAAIRGDTDSERCMFLYLTRLARRVRPGASPSLEDVRAALSDTVTTVARIADVPCERPSSLNFAATDGDVLAVCRRGRSLHVARDIGRSGVFAVASEPIGAGPWSEVPEEGFVGIDATHRVLQSPLHATAAALRPAG
jgi:glutamine amidotransferase